MGSIRLNDHPAVSLAPGGNLLDALLDAGLPAMYLCMAGSCGRCRCRVTAGAEALAPLNRAEEHHHCATDQRLACQASLVSDADVAIVQPA